MSFLEDISLLGGIANLFLAIFVLARGVENRAHRVYFFLGLAITVWNIGTFRLSRVASHDEALQAARFLQFGVIFVPVLLFHLSVLIAKLQYQKLLQVAYGFALFLAIGNGVGLFIKDVRHVGSAWYPVPGVLFWLFCLFFSLSTLAIVILVKRRATLRPLHRTRLTPLIVAQVVLTLLGANDFLPIVGMDYYPLTWVRVISLGGIGAICYGALTVYSVLQHQILDARMTLGRTTAHLTRALLLAAAAISFLMFFEVFLTQNHLLVGGLAFFCSALLGSYFFPRLFGRENEVLTEPFRGDRFEYHEKVRDFIWEMTYYSDTDTLLDDVAEVLKQEMGVASFRLDLLDEVSREFIPVRFQPAEESPSALSIHTDSAIFRWMYETDQVYLTTGLSYAVPGRSELELAAIQELQGVSFEVCFTLFSAGVPLGVLLLGEKQSGRRYATEDLYLLELFCRYLGLAIGQLRLQKQVLLAQETELLGRMSRGMAHDLNNLITPAWTYFQLASRDPLNTEDREELLPIASRNIETIRAYIREALFFSGNNKPNFEKTSLSEIVMRIKELQEPRLRTEAIALSVEGSSDCSLHADSVLLQRALNNLVSNAIDASANGDRIRIVWDLLSEKSKERWVRLRVIDEGEGMDMETLKKTGTPYFTTKNTGDKTRGFGLGLSICRRIVHLHGGHLRISSELGKGTIVQIELPETLDNTLV